LHKEQLEFEFDKKNYFLDISPVQDQYGIDWLVIVVIPESDFMVEITETNRTTFLIIIAALAISVLISILIARKIAARISFLNDATRAFTKDEGNAPNLANSHIREIDELTISFKEMEHQLRQTLASLKTEVGERKLVEHALRESETLFRAIFEQAAVGICTLSLDGKFLRVNQRFTKIVGYTHKELLDLSFQDITHPEELAINLKNIQNLVNNETASYSMEKRYFRKDGATTWVNQTVSLLRDMDEKPANFLSITEDITARKYAEKALEAVNNELRMSLEREKLLARTDGMTGLYNHRYFFELANREFRAAKRYHRPLAILMFDIDRFKQVNDTFGHAVGDKVLVQIAETLASQLRTADVLSRYGGDEFIIMLPQTSAQQALPLAERIRTSVEELSIEVENIPLSITLSIGIAEIQRELTDENIEYIAKRADKALYTAKHTGRNRTVTFDPQNYN
jgi:diguanylate cyclase (GGDEF)-like protein/PAS domain S-box-containing protein